MRRILFASLLAVLITACSPKSDTPKTEAIVKTADSGKLHHKIKIDIVPSDHSLIATDVLTIPARLSKNGVRVMINSDLTVDKNKRLGQFQPRA